MVERSDQANVGEAIQRFATLPALKPSTAKMRQVNVQIHIRRSGPVVRTVELQVCST